MNNFRDWTFDDYLAQFEKDKSVRWIEPMSAHEVSIYKHVPKPEEIAELKYDGHRGVLYLNSYANRAFSRTPSTKSGWFTENTDNVPHVRDLIHSLEGTILDGEFDYGNTSMGVQSVMGALPEKAIAFQEKNGKLPFKAFDILYYKGINIQKMPLWKRKIYLAQVVMELNSPYIEFATMYATDESHPVFLNQLTKYIDVKSIEYDFIKRHILTVNSYRELFKTFLKDDLEGIMIKSINGIYEQKRTKHYLKVKGVSTWDCVVMGFTPPTQEYTGKTLKTWKYWEIGGELMELSGLGEAMELASTTNNYAVPVTKPYFNGWCGSIEFGVWKPFTTEGLIREFNLGEITYDLEIDQLVDEGTIRHNPNGDYLALVHVGDCKGLADKELENIRINGDKLIGTVLEVKANGIIDEEKGSLRHSRFQKWRPDKTSDMCIWEDHIRKIGEED